MKKNKTYEQYKIGDRVRIEWQDDDGLYYETKGEIISLTEKSFLIDPGPQPVYCLDQSRDFVLIFSDSISTIKKV